jgi:hypothetical protein
MESDKHRIAECAKLCETKIWTVQKRNKEGLTYYVFSARQITSEQHIQFMNALRELHIITPIYVRWTTYKSSSNKNLEICKEIV